jgi:hypothetical protein
MPRSGSEISKGKMTMQERDLRSRLKQLVNSRGILHGTLNTRARTCGKSNCKCARGEKHVSLYLVVTEDGKTRHLYIPESHVGQVSEWVEQYQRALAILDEISQLHWTKIQNREK